MRDLLGKNTLIKLEYPAKIATKTLSAINKAIQAAQKE